MASSAPATIMQDPPPIRDYSGPNKSRGADWGLLVPGRSYTPDPIKVHADEPNQALVMSYVRVATPGTPAAAEQKIVAFFGGTTLVFGPQDSVHDHQTNDPFHEQVLLVDNAIRDIKLARSGHEDANDAFKDFRDNARQEASGNFVPSRQVNIYQTRSHYTTERYNEVPIPIRIAQFNSSLDTMHTHRDSLRQLHELAGGTLASAHPSRPQASNSSHPNNANNNHNLNSNSQRAGRGGRGGNRQASRGNRNVCQGPLLKSGRGKLLPNGPGAMRQPDFGQSDLSRASSTSDLKQYVQPPIRGPHNDLRPNMTKAYPGGFPPETFVTTPYQIHHPAGHVVLRSDGNGGSGWVMMGAGTDSNSRQHSVALGSNGMRGMDQVTIGPGFYTNGFQHSVFVSDCAPSAQTATSGFPSREEIEPMMSTPYFDFNNSDQYEQSMETPLFPINEHSLSEQTIPTPFFSVNEQQGERMMPMPYFPFNDSDQYEQSIETPLFPINESIEHEQSIPTPLFPINEYEHTSQQTIPTPLFSVNEGRSKETSRQPVPPPDIRIDEVSDLSDYAESPEYPKSAPASVSGPMPMGTGPMPGRRRLRSPLRISNGSERGRSVEQTNTSTAGNFGGSFGTYVGYRVFGEVPGQVSRDPTPHGPGRRLFEQGTSTRMSSPGVGSSTVPTSPKHFSRRSGSWAP